MTMLKPRLLAATTPLDRLVKNLDQLSNLIEKTNNSVEASQLCKDCYQLAAHLEPYLKANTTPHSQSLNLIEEVTESEDWQQDYSDKKTVRKLENGMLSGHVEGQFLKMIVHMTQAKNILEIGMFTGYSALAMAESMPSTGKLIACEVDSYAADIAQKCFDASPHGNKITIKLGAAQDTLQELAEDNQSFDLVFIDADKTGYWTYYQTLLGENLVSSGSFICVDNTLLQGRPYFNDGEVSDNGSAIAQFNQNLAMDDRVEQVILPLRDGLTIIRCK